MIMRLLNLVEMIFGYYKRGVNFGGGLIGFV